MKKLLLALLLLPARYCCAQPKRPIVHLNLPSLIDFVGFPTIQGGIEVPLWGRLSWYNEFGWRIFKHRYRPYDTLFVPERGYKLKTEFRYYFSHNTPSGHNNYFTSKQEDYYIALNAFYIYDSHNNKLWYSTDTDPAFEKIDCFGVEKKIWGFNVVAGVQGRLSKQWILDAYAGIGGRFRYYNNTNMEIRYKTDSVAWSRHPNVFDIADQGDVKGGFSFMPNFTLGVRIGYRF